MNIRGAIFDADGTLLDSMFLWNTIGEDYLRSLGMEPEEDLNETVKSMSLYQAARHYQSVYGVTLSTDEIMAGVNAIVERYYRDAVQLKAGVSEFLALLHRRNVRLCVATATDRYLVEAVLERLGIRRYFLEIFTCTDVGHGKDEPVIFETALSFLATPKAETPVFEDALYAARTAKAAGFRVVAIYDRYETQQTALRALADGYITDFTQAEEVLFT